MYHNENEGKSMLEYFLHIKTPTAGFELTTSGLEVQHTERQENIITNCVNFPKT